MSSGNFPIVEAATPTDFTFANFVSFLNAQGTWEWRLISFTYFTFFFFYVILFSLWWNQTVADANIGLKRDEVSSNEYI